MAINDPRPLTRDDLAKFLPNQRAIRAFEKLFSLIPSSLSTNEIAITLVEELVTQVRIEAESAIARSSQILAQLTELTSAVESVSLKSESHTDENIDIIPASKIGTLGEQNADDVDITSGSITATLTDDSTNLIASSAALSNGAAAAAGTLTNAPAAGDPTKWVAIDDNGTTRYIPAW
jgi:hypothetical protein